MVTGRDVAGIVSLGVAPDLLGAIPAAVWALGESDPLEVLLRFALSTPGAEPAMDPWAFALEHNLHCAAHSVVIAAAATVLLWRVARAFLPWTLGWWLHILVDIPTHASDYYPVPIFYPFSRWGFDGIAWTTPTVWVLNYVILAATYAALMLGSRSARR